MLKRLHLLPLLLVALAACQPDSNSESPASVPAAKQTPAVAYDNESARLNAWFEEKFEQQLQMSPAWLTRLGRKEQYDRYDDFTEAEADRQLAWQADTVAELKSEFSYDALDFETQTSYDLWVYRYEQAKEGRDYRRQNYLFTQMNGPQSSVARFMISFHKVERVEDMRAYIARIGAISSSISQLLERARLQAAEGVRPPAFAYQRVITEATNLISGAPFTATGKDSPLWADAQSKISALEVSGEIDAATADELRSAARSALKNEFYPTYAALVDWFGTDLDNADLVAQGVGSRPGGDAFYAYRLRAVTTTDLSAEEIHEIGLAEVARISAEMQSLLEQIGFTGSLQDFFAFLQQDEQFYYPNTDAGRQGYLDDSEAYLAFIKRRLPDYFGTLPKADLVVKRVEAFREQDGAAQHYVAGTPDGARPGVYYAHLLNMRSMPKDQMEAVAYHEGIPGHHMQISIAQELTDLPTFRTQTGYTAFSEGWGLYAELLAKEMGAYQDVYSEFGRLTTEMWRAVRLVVDTGLHAKGWSEEGAVAYFQLNTPIAEGAVRSEVRRYLVMPGQATAYKIGMLKILQLREYAQAELGEQFDIREFHDVVLGGGGLPLTILDRRVHRWVAEQKAAAA